MVSIPYLFIGSIAVYSSKTAVRVDYVGVMMTSCIFNQMSSSVGTICPLNCPRVEESWSTELSLECCNSPAPLSGIIHPCRRFFIFIFCRRPYNPYPCPPEAAAVDAQELESEKRETMKSHVLLEARRARLTAELQVRYERGTVYTGSLLTSCYSTCPHFSH